MSEIAEVNRVRERIDAFAEQVARLPNQYRDEDYALEHVFTPGVYVRTLRLPAGMVVVGKIHRHEHWNILQSGCVSVYSQDGCQTLSGPQAMVSSAGVKRCVYAHTDAVWTTVHHNPQELRDLRTLEDFIIAPDYAQLPPEVAAERIES